MIPENTTILSTVMGTVKNTRITTLFGRYTAILLMLMSVSISVWGETATLNYSSQTSLYVGISGSNCSWGSSAGYNTSSTNAKVTFTPQAGATITGIVFTFASSDADRVGGTPTVSSGSYNRSGSTGTWSGLSATEAITWTATNKFRMTNIEVTFTMPSYAILENTTGAEQTLTIRLFESGVYTVAGASATSLGEQLFSVTKTFCSNPTLISLQGSCCKFDKATAATMAQIGNSSSDKLGSLYKIAGDNNVTATTGGWRGFVLNNVVRNVKSIQIESTSGNAADDLYLTACIADKNMVPSAIGSRSYVRLAHQASKNSNITVTSAETSAIKNKDLSIGFAWYRSGSSVKPTAVTLTIVFEAGESCSAPGKPTISGGYHYFPGETIALTAAATGTNGSTTYAWKKGGSTVAGQTTANLSIASCTAANAGKYTVVASNGGGCESVSSDEFGVKILQFYLKNNSGGDISNAPLTKVNGTTAQIELALNGNTTYKFRITDGCNNWYGNTGTMTSSNCTSWSMDADADCGITTTKTGTYTFNVNYSDLAHPSVSVVYPSSNQAASKVIYFDNASAQWANLHYRIGKSDHTQAAPMTKVTGTDNLYKVTTSAYSNFDAWHIGNNSGWTGTNTIYRTNASGYNITKSTSFIGDAVTQDITITPGNDHTTGSDALNNNCEFYSYSKANGMKSHTATITAPSNGTITVAYKDVDNIDKNFTSGNKTLAHTCILTITATPATGYSLSGMTVNGDAFTSGNTHILSTDATIAATFTANQYTVTLHTNDGTINAGNVANYTYGVGATLPTNVTKDGYTFGGWFDNSGFTGSAITTIANNATGNKEYWAKWTEDSSSDCFSMTLKSGQTITDLTSGATRELTSTYATISGGQAWLGNKNSDATKCKMNNDAHIQFVGGDCFVRVEMDNALAVGSIIAYTNSKSNTEQLCFTTTNTRSTTYSGTSGSYTVKAGDALIGATTFYVWRAGSSSAYLKTLTVTNCGATPVGGPYPTPAAVASPGTINYTADATDFLNPERGFMSQMQWNTSGGNNHGLTAGSLNASQTLVQRIYYMDNNTYRTGALPQSFLDLVSSDMAVLRANGKKAILRFCYDETMGSGTSKSDYEDATPARWTAHLAQLKPVLAANEDVIFTVQAGFIGVWGEWYYSSQGNNNGGGIPDATQFALIDNLLDAVPASRTIEIRYVDGLRKYLASRGETNKRRLGFHNDAYLNGEENMGTYRWGHVSEDRAYTAAQGLLAPNGGETNLTSGQANASSIYTNYSTGAKAAADMRELHYTYLNSLYSDYVLNQWKTETYTDGKSYYNIMSGYMGYRFQLHSATFPANVVSGANMSVFINLHNVGYAPLYNARTAYIVLKNNEHTYEFPLSANPCSWQPDGALATINENITLAGVVAGTYDLYLWLPDKAASIKSNPAYAIRFANTGVWQSATGYNSLNHQVTVTGSTGHTITFHDGHITDTQAVPDNVATPLKMLSTIGWTKTRHTFAGWAETEDGAVVYTDGDNITATADKDLYAKWTPDVYNITYYDEDMETELDLNPKTYTYGVGVAELPTPVKVGYTFNGWKLWWEDGEGLHEYDKSSGILPTDFDHVQLHATWTATVATYAITYAANGGTGTMSAAREYEADEQVTIKTNAFTAPTGKEFVGWVVTNNSTHAAITVTAGKFVMPTAAVTITAQWRDKVVSGCNMIFYFAKATDAANQTPPVEQNTTFFTGVPTGNGSMSGSMTIDGIPYSISGRHSNGSLDVSFTIPDDKTGVLYVIVGGGSGKKLQIKSGSDVIEEKDCTSAPSYLEFAQLSSGSYKLVNAGGNVGLGMLAIQLCDAVASCASPTIDAATATPAAVCAGAEVTLSASATKNETGSGALTYQWYKSDNTTAGAAGAEITVYPEETTSYYVLVTDADCATPAKSGSVTVTVNPATAITTQPTAATAASVGETVSLSVVATGSHLSYQWQQSADGAAWTNVTNSNATAKQATLSVKVTAMGTMYYRCVVSGDCGEDVTSSLATVTAGAAAPTVTWSDVTTVYQGQKISVSVTTNTDADFDASALTITTDYCSVASKTQIGKTIVAELHINTDATADAEITLTFNTSVGTSYGATVDNTHTLTVSDGCPAGGASGTIYTATISGQSTISATGGEAEVSSKMNSSPKPLNSNNYYKFDTSSKLKFTPTGGFLVGDKLTFNLISSGNNTDGVIIKNAAGTQLADLTTALSNSENRTITYTFTAATDFVTVMRHSSSCYFYSATVDRRGSLTNLEWHDTDDMIEDGVVTVSSEAEDFTIAAASNNSFGAITYSIAPAGVATINTTTGEIHPVANGTATVTATIATNGCYSTKNITYTLKVADDCVAPTISAHPASATYVVNTTASALSVTASGSELSYQWYRNSENNNTSGTAIGGATSASYTPDVTTRGTVYYYCEVKSGKCGTLSNVATIEVTRPACALAQPKIIEVSRTGGDCWTSITLKAVAQDDTDLDGGTYQWYHNGEPVSTTAQPTITAAGTYTLDYSKDECTTDASNSFVAASSNPELGQLSPFQYYHAGKSDYSEQMNSHHLFTYASISSAEPTYSATKNTVALAGDELAALQGALERVEGQNNVDTIMLSLNDLAGCGFVAGDEVVITVTPKDCSGADVPGEAKSITLHVVDARPTLAFIVSGADGEGTKVKKNLKLNGDFLTGYNKADLKVQSEKEAVTAAELPLYTALKENYNVVPVNGYAPFSKWNYEPFDLTFLTDFVKTDGGSDKAAAKEKVNQLAGIVDFRPLFSTKSFMSGITNWTKLGFSAQPLVPKMTQKWMNIICYAHPMFDEFLSDGSNKVLEEQPNGGTEVVFTMLSQGGFDASKGIQGFDLTDASAFVNIATTHYNAEAGIVTDPETGERTCQPTNIGDGDKLLVASCERQKNIEARMIILSVNADAHSFLTDEGIDVIILSLNYLLMTDPMDVTDCSITFMGNTDTDWNTATNWNNGKVPTEKNNVRIAAECHVNGTNAVAGSVKILKDNAAEDGSLVIEPTGALKINGAISRVEGGAYLTLLPTHAEDVQIRSAASGNGALIHADETGIIQATVQMYSIAHGEADEEQGPGYIKNAVWQWMTTPFKDANRAVNYYHGAWMYTYDNAAHAWDPQVHNESSLTPFRGYAITQLAPTTYYMTGTLVPTTTTELPLHSGLNLIGNSWTAPIDITKMVAADFNGAEATIVMFNTGLDEEGTGSTVSGVNSTTAGTYVSIPVNASIALDELKVIPSMQAFEVKATSNGSLTLDYNRIVRGTDAVNIQPMRAPSRVNSQERDFGNGIDARLRISVAGQRYSDVLYLLRQPSTTMGFDNGWDGMKVYSDNYDIPVLYVENGDGDWQVSTQPTFSGTQFGFYRGEDQQTTVHFQYEGDETLWFYDRQTDEYTLVDAESTYTFMSYTYDLERRFMLTDYNPKAPAIPTDIEDISPTAIRIVQEADGLVLAHDGSGTLHVNIYDPAGRLLSTSASNAPMVHVALPAAQGAYLIDCKLGDVHQVIKVVR